MNKNEVERGSVIQFDVYVIVMRFLDDVEDFLSLCLSIKDLFGYVKETGLGAENILFRLYDFPKTSVGFVRKIFIYCSRQLDLITLNRYFKNLNEILYIPFLEDASLKSISIKCDEKSMDTCPHTKIRKIEMLCPIDIQIANIPSLRKLIVKKPKEMNKDDLDFGFSTFNLSGVPKLTHLKIKGNWRFSPDTLIERFKSSLQEVDLEIEQVSMNRMVQFSEYTNLTYLTLSLQFNDLERISNCPKLRFLELVNSGGMKDIILEKLPSIHSVVLRGDCGRIKIDETLHGIRRLKVLGTTELMFELQDCKQIEDLEFMNLQYRDFSSSSKLLIEEVGRLNLSNLGIHVRVPQLKVRVFDLPHLTQLKISSCQIPRLKSLPRLTHMNLIFLPLPSYYSENIDGRSSSGNITPTSHLIKSFSFIGGTPVLSPSVSTSFDQYQSVGIIEHIRKLRNKKENIKLNRLIQSFGNHLQTLSIQFSQQSEVLLDLGEEMKCLREIFIGSFSRNFEHYDSGLPYEISRYFVKRYKYSPLSKPLHQISTQLPSIFLSKLPELQTLQIISRVGCLMLNDLQSLRNLTFNQLFKIDITHVPYILRMNLVLAKQWMFAMIRTDKIRKLSLQLSEISRIDGNTFPNLRHLVLLKYVIVKSINSLPELRTLEVFQSSFENISNLKNIQNLMIDFSNPNPEPYEIDFSGFGKKVKSLVIVDSNENEEERANIYYRNLDKESFPNLERLEIHTMTDRISSIISDFEKLKFVFIVHPSIRISRIILSNLPSLKMVRVTSRMNQEIDFLLKRCNPKVKLILK